MSNKEALLICNADIISDCKQLRSNSRYSSPFFNFPTIIKENKRVMDINNNILIVDNENILAMLLLNKHYYVYYY